VGLGDTVRIVNDEQAVRAMQSGHGGWNTQMKNVCRIRSQLCRCIYDSD